MINWVIQINNGLVNIIGLTVSLQVIINCSPVHTFHDKQRVTMEQFKAFFSIAKHRKNYLKQ